MGTLWPLVFSFRIPNTLADNPFQSEPPRPKTMGWFRKNFFRGLATALPTVATLAVLVFVIDTFYHFLAKPVVSALGWVVAQSETGAHFLENYPLLGDILLTIVVCILAFFFFAIIGILMGGILGRTLIGSIEKWLMQIPLIRAIYPSAKQVVGFFSKKQKPEFHAVVAIPYPHKEIYSIGFVTSDGLKTLNEKTGASFVSVFVPCSPLPMTGWVSFVPVENIIVLSMPVDDAFRTLVSCGMIVPEQEKVALGHRSLLSKEKEG